MDNSYSRYLILDDIYFWKTHKQKGPRCRMYQLMFEHTTHLHKAAHTTALQVCRKYHNKGCNDSCNMNKIFDVFQKWYITVRDRVVDG